MVPSSASGQDIDGVAAGLAAVLPALHRALDRRLAQDLPYARLPEGQLAVLRLVAERDGITVGEAAEALLMKPNNVSTLVSGLVGQGLLERLPDASDKRVVHLRVTGEARHRIAVVNALRDGYLTEGLRALTDGDLDALGSALGALSVLARRIHPSGH
ncbi:MarR family transcriptional regulator [Streptomyces pactum]|uniref:MarR family transcriptional regulator n=1 Tax=Streptomyces pactum TaxID=68249 RepID=A0ABS0NS67_9ACTN|nr:MarR family transcriptional regulator [Streptomyces pactum]MBH5338053.1 MarR family transcriptional regulator [Streptomyces pactum]